MDCIVFLYFITGLFKKQTDIRKICSIFGLFILTNIRLYYILYLQKRTDVRKHAFAYTADNMKAYRIVPFRILYKSAVKRAKYHSQKLRHTDTGHTVFDKE